MTVSSEEMAAAHKAPPDLIAITEAAKRYNVPYSTLKSWLRRNKIEKWERDIDGRVFVRASDIERAIRIHPVAPDAPENGNEPEVPGGSDGASIPD